MRPRPASATFARGLEARPSPLDQLPRQPESGESGEVEDVGRADEPVEVGGPGDVENLPADDERDRRERDAQLEQTSSLAEEDPER